MTTVPSWRVPRLAVIQLADEPPVTVGNEQYYHTAEGYFLRSRQVRVITRHDPPTDLTAPDEKWIDVNLDHQSVVAYEGTRPVYVSVVSTGRRNRTNPDENYETVQGGFRILSKHVATTMDGNSANDGPYSIEDVPWVMYFEGSFALHGAFWHNGFGAMHSHGCVNMSPPDARWFYNWTEPHVAPGWNGAYATAQHPGTRVYVHYDEQVLGTRGGPERVPQH
jgi:lipoprotein-anchoring transpeptidase ErfK/SrfK